MNETETKKGNLYATFLFVLMIKLLLILPVVGWLIYLVVNYHVIKKYALRKVKLKRVDEMDSIIIPKNIKLKVAMLELISIPLVSVIIGKPLSMLIDSKMVDLFGLNTLIVMVLITTSMGLAGLFLAMVLQIELIMNSVIKFQAK
ncbi:hypothetical protein [Aureibacter tunicatorum]|uniref:Uncharacterized protein n=1 Tax=Aureibacter tunicatorum TaxID=866807 RepID=A0AAE3XRW3_9BACT|nr:hypothetical protein [Aureibacter tunicatorum]MDR6240825.1 hypothetical protein [Aureibacter tunicatorum]BDD06842.1 hypothetical protein AUTU_43250 [Aureibacter tunicatorum]